MSLDLSSFDAALKQHYTADAVENMVYKDNPLLAILPKYETFGGKNLPIPIIFGNPQGRSKTFANAQARGAVTNSQIVDFVLTRVRDYSIATIDNETLEASKGDANAFMEAATTEIDGAIQSLTRSLAVGVYGGADGNIGQVAAEPSEDTTTVITLKAPDSVTNFEVGMALNIYVDKAVSSTKKSVDGSTVQLIISAVDRSAGTITFADAYDASGTIAADDFLFVEGDRGLALSGLDSWLPETAPQSGDPQFFGVDRSTDATRLAGVRHDGSNQPIEEALVDGASKVGREGGKVDYCFMNYQAYADLEKALGSKVQYVDLKMNAEIGFRGIEINGPRGMIKVVADQNCPAGVAYMLQMDKWKLYSLGKAVKVIDSDGLTMLRQSSADGIEVRYGFYGQVGSRAPGFSCRVQLS